MTPLRALCINFLLPIKIALILNTDFLYILPLSNYLSGDTSQTVFDCIERLLEVRCILKNNTPPGGIDLLLKGDGKEDIIIFYYGYAR